MRSDASPVSTAALDVLLANTAAPRAAAFEKLHYWIGAYDAAATSEANDGVAMARYIHARRMVQVGALDEAILQFQKVREGKALDRMLMEQAALGLATALAKSHRAAEAESMLVEAADAADRPAARLLLRDRAERAARAKNAPQKPAAVTEISNPAWADALLLGIDPEGGI